jgi:copper chaperone CopZ
MHRFVLLAVAALLFSMLANIALAEEAKVTLEKVHLCCNSCVKGAQKAVSSVSGAAATCDQKAGTIAITAPDKETAQKAVDALVDAGYYGKATGASIKESEASGTLKSATVSGFHNCCKKCTTILNETIQKAGVKGEVEPKATTFTVTGDIDQKKLIQAFEDAGFHVKVEGK